MVVTGVDAIVGLAVDVIVIVEGFVVVLVDVIVVVVITDVEMYKFVVVVGDAFAKS